jgi:hypothetical protein
MVPSRRRSLTKRAEQGREGGIPIGQSSCIEGRSSAAATTGGCNAVRFSTQMDALEVRGGDRRRSTGECPHDALPAPCSGAVVLQDPRVDRR